MPTFNYKAKDKFGADVSGAMEAQTSLSAATRLNEMGYTPITIIKQEASLFSVIEGFASRFQPVRQDEMIVFVRQLSSILAAGVPLLESLTAVYEQVQSPRFKKVIFALRQDIEGGSSFSEALSNHKNVFSQMFISMVHAGERAGILGEVLDRLGTLLERDFDNAQKIKSATRYPLIIIAALITAFIVVITLVIPKFSDLYSSFKIDLPLPTRILIGLNYFMLHYWIISAAIIMAFVYFLRRFFSTGFGRMMLDTNVLKIPVFGQLLKKLILARFCRMLGAMLKSGIPITEALTITGGTIENQLLAKVVEGVRLEVIKGSGLSEPMREAKVFPPLVVQMVAIGEKSGALESMLSKVADYFDRDTDYTIKNLTPLLEPFLILILGIFVLVLALGVFLPMWDMIKIAK
ncbi:type II secretion system F family protein [Candidatus Saganbacteria bacterium]|nr:type II secretion system F family protein [Candidatus Saganbacteria bacterium]